jgi:hypothetical protein
MYVPSFWSDTQALDTYWASACQQAVHSNVVSRNIFFIFLVTFLKYPEKQRFYLNKLLPLSTENNLNVLFAY